jgi:hypothetical protein
VSAFLLPELAERRALPAVQVRGHATHALESQTRARGSSASARRGGRRGWEHPHDSGREPRRVRRRARRCWTIW